MTSNTLTITRTGHSYFTAQVGDKFASMLGSKEALFVAACFAMGGGIPYLHDYLDWAAREKRYGGYVEPAALLPAPKKHTNANLALARELVREAAGVSCPLIRSTYIERIAEALG